MRRGLWVVAGLISLGAVAGWVWSRPAPVGPAVPPTPSTPTVTSKWETPIAPRGQRSLTGRVTRKGAPVAGAQVVAVAPTEGEPLLTERPCPCNEACGLPMLGCEFGVQSDELGELLATRTGEAVPVARTTTDAEGRFSLTGLGDEVVTLWAEAEAAKYVGFRGHVERDAADVEVALGPSRTLEGVVRRGEATVAGALVTAVERGLPRFFDAVSGADGTFALRGVPEGDWVIFASQGDARGFDFARPREWQTLDVELAEPRRLDGRVLFANDEPVPDVEVTLDVTGEHLKRTRTDATGAFAFERVRAEYAVLRVDDARGLGSYFERRSRPADARVIRLFQSRTVRGRVVDDDGRPVAALPVRVRDRLREQTTTTGPDGRFELPRVSPGNCNLSVTADGFLPTYEAFTTNEVNVTVRRGTLIRGRVIRPGSEPVLVSARRDATQQDYNDADDTTGWYDSVTTLDGGFTLTVVPGRYQLTATGQGARGTDLKVTAPANDVVLELGVGARLRGRVLDEKGRPEAGARVLAQCPLTETKVIDEQMAQTDALGEFDLRGLGACEATVQVDGDKATYQREVVLREGETTTVEFSPELGAPLAGVVVDSEGAPVAGVSLQATAHGVGRRAATDTSDEKGTFRLIGLPAGRVTLLAWLEERDTHLEVDAPNESLTVTLSSKTEIGGRVVDPSGRPLPSFVVNGQDVSAADGRFRQTVRADARLSSFSAQGFVPLKRPLRLGPGLNELGDVALSSGRDLSGRVVDGESGEPISGVRIAQQGNESLGTSSVDGRFQLTVDPAGGDLSFEHRDYLVRKGPAPERSPCEVALTAGFTLSVRVFDAGGKPLRSVSVRARQGEQTRSLRPVNGVFSASGFAPGKWTVIAETMGDRVWRPVEVELAGSTSLDLREATDGVSVKVDVPGSRFIGLVPGEVVITQYEDLVGQPVVAEVNQGVARHVLPGRWTVLAVKSGTGRELMLSRTVIDVPAEGEPVVTITPEWFAVTRVPPGY